MNELIIETKDCETIAIRGSINRLNSHKRATRMLKDFFTCTYFDEHIEITGITDFSDDINKLKKILLLSGCNVVFNDETDYRLQEYLLEERKFEIFSQKALDIRNNHCDITDFTAFKDALTKYLPNRTLYPLQLLSSYHLAFAQNACNFSVPGAGKTSIVFGAYSYLKNLPEGNPKKIDRLLIIGPLSSFKPWEDEYEECFGQNADSKRLVGALSIDEKKQYLYSDNPAEITLMSYQSTVSLCKELAFFLDKNRTMVVLDEAHKIKNYKAGVIADSILSISDKCKSRVILTGTPAPNGYEDLYNLYNFIWPGRKIIKFSPGQLKDLSKNSSDYRIDILIDQISPYFIRIKKSDLGIPPAIIHPPIRIPMKDGQRRLYDFIERRAMTDIASIDNSVIGNSLRKARIIRMMQAASNPKLLKKPLKEYAMIEGGDVGLINDDGMLESVLDLIPDEIPAKFEALKSLTNDIVSKGEKVVIWANYIQTIEDISDYLLCNSINNKILYGGTPVASENISEEDELYELTREAIIKEFNDVNSNLNVIIANPFAVAESISLHTSCHNAIYYERSFNAAHFIQSKDRIHRYGLKEGTETNYYFLVSENSIDETIDERLIEKENRLNEIMESMPIPLFANVLEGEGDEDIKAIMRDYARRTKAI